MIEYWQWQQLHYGTETYWGSVLPHDRKPGRVYKEISALGEELEKAGNQVTDLKPDADITMLYSVNSRWGLSFEPYTSPNAVTDPHKVRNPNVFDHMLAAFYDGAFVSGRQVNLMHDSQLVDLESGKHLQKPEIFVKTHPVLLAVGIYISSDELLQWLRDYVANGGHLVLGPRSTYADSLARARMETKPAKLNDLAQTSYQEFSNLQKSVPVVGTKKMPVREGSEATEWIDCLESNGSEVIATSDDPHFKQFPLVTTTETGNGAVTVVGTVPNPKLAASIYDYLLPEEKWVLGHETVTHSSAVNKQGERLHFLFNWNWESVSLKLPVACVPLGQTQSLNSIQLKSWDAVVLKEQAD